MIKRIALLVALFILSLSAPVAADEPGSGIIEGQIVNGTAGGSSVADQDITLNIYLDEAEVDTAATKSDDGWFVFDGLSTAPGYRYEAVVNFQRAEYYGERLNFDEGETTRSTEIIVYDSTTSDEAITIAMSHTIIYVEESTLLVKEYYLFTNEADRTYIGSADAGNTEVLRFFLPGGATELQSNMELMECCIVMNEKGFADAMPALPGMKEVAYSYRVNYNSGTYTFSPMINYPTNRFDLLVQGEDIKVTSDQLAIDAPMDISGIRFNHLSGQGFAVDETLVIRLSGLPRTNTQGSILWVLLALIIIGAGFVFIYLIRKKRLQPVSDEGGPSLRKQRLLTELAELDDDFGDGRISEEAYRKLRDEKKVELIALMHKSEEE